MELKKSLLAATTATAVAFGGASIATAQDGSSISVSVSSNNFLRCRSFLIFKSSKSFLAFGPSLVFSGMFISVPRKLSRTFFVICIGSRQ